MTTFHHHILAIQKPVLVFPVQQTDIVGKVSQRSSLCDTRVNVIGLLGDGTPFVGVNISTAVQTQGQGIEETDTLVSLMSPYTDLYLVHSDRQSQTGLDRLMQTLLSIK